MNKSNILFFLNTFNDIDHISPIIWKVLEKKDNAYIIFINDYDYTSDYRISFLQKYSNLKIYKFPLAYKNSFIGKIIREICYNRYYCTSFLKKLKINACVFEWDEIHKRGLLGNFFHAAKKEGIPTFCVPHGFSIYLNNKASKNVISIYEKTGRGPDYSNRNGFDTYVYQSPHVLMRGIDWGQDPEKTFAWGCARYYPEWAKINLSLCPKFVPEKEVNSKIKVVFMLPHWDYNVDKEKCLDLIDKLIDKEWVYLIIKDHTRGVTGGLSNNLRKKYNSLHNVEASVSAHSPTLIEWSDIVISFGSSIGIEVLLQDKHLINPSYLHSNRTIFDETLACHLAKSHLVVMNLLKDYRNKVLKEIPLKNKDQLYREVIYGGKEEFNVLEYYYNKIVNK